jgi:two-component system chemotaxis response regulator CheB
VARKARLLIAHDSVNVRRTLSRILSLDPSCDVVGVAPNGRIVLAKVSRLEPDVVLVDADMPEMSGGQTALELRKLYPQLPVIVFRVGDGDVPPECTPAQELVAFIDVPGSGDAGEAALAELCDRLMARVRILSASKTADAPAGTAGASSSSRMLASRRVGANAYGVLAIGASTGGPNALAEVLAGVPNTFPIPIVIVQHMPPMFTRLLAERLSATSSLRVREARGGETIEPGEAWIAPGDHHMIVSRHAGGVRLGLHQAAHENSCRPAVDVLFRSIADVYGATALAVVLTGMGQDGLRGAQEIHDAGGVVLAQDEASSVVWGMPGLVAKTGIAHAVVPLAEMHLEILRRVSRARASSPPLAPPMEVHHGD